jgi:hypothetical protein
LFEGSYRQPPERRWLLLQHLPVSTGKRGWLLACIRICAAKIRQDANPFDPQWKSNFD